MKPSNLTLGLAGLLFTATTMLHACSSSSGGSSFPANAPDGGLSSGGGYTSSGGLNLSSSGGSSTGGNGTSSSAGSSGTGSGGTSTSSSGSQPFVCGGCIDLSGRCRDGGEDIACGLTQAGAPGSVTCTNCTQEPSTPVCSDGNCVSGAAGSSSGGSSSSGSASGGSGGADAGPG